MDRQDGDFAEDFAAVDLEAEGAVEVSLEVGLTAEVSRAVARGTREMMGGRMKKCIIKRDKSIENFYNYSCILFYNSDRFETIDFSFFSVLTLPLSLLPFAVSRCVAARCLPRLLHLLHLRSR